MKFVRELTHLNSFNNEILDSMLDSNVTVSIKIDTSAFVIMRDGDTCRFFGREGKNEIDINKRAVNSMYEKFIRHVLSNDRWKSLPDKHKIFTELFLPNLPSIIKYTVSPKNDLIISYVVDESGKILKPDNEIVNRIADLLDISRAPVIFSGRINQSAKDKIKKYTETGEFDRPTFLEFVFSLFTPPQDLKWLVKDGFEGVVMYFGSSDFPIMAKLVDPVFTSQVKAKKSEDSYYSTLAESVWKILENMTAWVESRIVNLRDGEKITAATPLIQVCADITNEMVSQYKETIEKCVERFEEDVISSRFFQLTQNLVPKEILELSNQVWFAQDVFSILVNGLKTSKKPNSKMDSKKREVINKIVSLISSIPTNYVFESSAENLSIIPGRFQPFHLGHLQMVKKCSGSVIFVVIKGEKSSKNSDKNPFDAADQIRWIKKCLGSSVRVTSFQNGFMPDVIAHVQSMFEGAVREVICGDDRIEGYRSQLSNTDINVKLVRSERITDASKIREALLNDDKETFLDLMPTPLHSEYDYMKRIMELKRTR